MPLLNIFAAKELDDWSGKKTVKTGQVGADTTTTVSSMETELALPLRHHYVKANSLLETCKETEACSKSGSSTDDASSDDNSTFVVSEGQFVEQFIERLHESDSDDGDDTLDAMDDLSLDGLGAGCMELPECGDLNVDVESPEYVDSEAHEYWKRVTANRKRSMVGKVTIQDVPVQDLPSQSYDTATEDDETEKYADKTEIEVVHTGMKYTYNSEPETRKESSNKGKTRTLRKLVQTLSTKIPRHANSDEVIKSEEDSTPEAAVYLEKEEGCEVKLKPSRASSGLSKLAKMLSKKKLFSHEEAIAAIEYSCASSTEDKWALFGDKYKTPEDFSISDTGKEFEEEAEPELEKTHTEESAANEALEVPDVEGLDPSVGTLSENRPALPRRSKSMTDTLKKTGSAAKRAIRSRASLMRKAMSMKYDSSAFSASGSSGSKVSKSTATTEQLPAESKDLSKAMKIGENGKRSGSERLRRQLGKSFRRSVSLIKKLSSKEGPVSGANLVVCIDGKGDRVNPKKDSDSESGRKTNTSRDIENQQETSNDGENSVVGSIESTGLIVEVDGPGVCRMCIRDCSNMSLAHGRARGRYAIGEEDNSLCGSMISDGRNTVFSDNTGWFLAKEGIMEASSARGSEPKKVVKRLKSDDNLSRFGVESPYEDFPPEMIEATSQFEETSEASDDSKSDSSNDLNSLSSSVTGSGDESILYELFPSDSFSSLTGIRCDEVGPEDSGLALACADRVSKCAPMRTSMDNEDLGKANALVRGRPKKQSLEHKASRKLSPTEESPELQSAGKGFRHEEEDSIVECIGVEVPVGVPQGVHQGVPQVVPSPKAPASECCSC